MEDLISRKAAIDVLMAILDRPNHAEFLYTDEICKALKQLPSAQPEQAIKDCRNCKHGSYNDHWDTYFCYCSSDCSDWNKWEPSAQPEHKRGRWQEITESDCSGYDPVLAGYDDPVVGFICSVCHEGYEKEVMGETIWNFCPHCGADMR